MSSPEISVIIPTFNRAEHVIRAIESVLSQSYKDYEIIVVDDGSTDKTKDALEHYMDRIKYIYQDNSGVSSARNKGIMAARGEWVAFLDSDDEWLPEKLEIQIDCIKETKEQICFTNIFVPCDGHHLNSRPVTEPKENKVIFTDPVNLILDGTRPLYTQTMLIKKELLFKVGCFDELLKVGEDTLIFFRLATEASFVFLEKPLVSFYTLVSPGSVAPHKLTNSSLSAKEQRCYAGLISLSEIYYRKLEYDKVTVKKIRRSLGRYLSRQAVYSCLRRNSRARSFAIEAILFGGGLGSCLRSMSVLLCPWFVRYSYRKQENK